MVRHNDMVRKTSSVTILPEWLLKESLEKQEDAPYL